MQKRDEADLALTGDPTKDSVLRTEKFLEKRRRRERYLQKQISDEQQHQLERGKKYEDMVGRKTTSRESLSSRESQRSISSRGSNRSTSKRGQSRGKQKLPGLRKKNNSSKHRN